MKKIIRILISVALVSACTGKSPNPIPPYQPSDENLSCSASRQELMDVSKSKIINFIPK